MEASGGEAGGEMWWSVGGADVSVVSVGVRRRALGVKVIEGVAGGEMVGRRGGVEMGAVVAGRGRGRVLVMQVSEGVVGVAMGVGWWRGDGCGGGLGGRSLEIEASGGVAGGEMGGDGGGVVVCVVSAGRGRGRDLVIEANRGVLGAAMGGWWWVAWMYVRCRQGGRGRVSGMQTTGGWRWQGCECDEGGGRA